MSPVLLAADAEAQSLEGLRHRRRVDHVRVLMELLRRPKPNNQMRYDTRQDGEKEGKLGEYKTSRRGEGRK